MYQFFDENITNRDIIKNQTFLNLAKLAPELVKYIPLLKSCSPEDIDDILCEDEETDEQIKIYQSAIGMAIGRKFTSFTGFSTYGEQLRPWGCDPGYSKLESRLPIYTDESLLLMGACGLRLLSIACHLKQDAEDVYIIGVDTSCYINNLWSTVLDFMRAHDADDLSRFPTILPECLEDLDPDSNFIAIVKSESIEYTNKELQPYFKSDDHLDYETLTYIRALVHFYGYEQVKTLVSKALILPCDWSDPRLVELVKDNQAFKHAFPYTKVIAYLSNIVSYSCSEAEHNAIFRDNVIEYTEAQNVLSNVNLINPDLAIHGDFLEKKEQSLNYNRYECDDMHFISKDNHADFGTIRKQLWKGAETKSVDESVSKFKP